MKDKIKLFGYFAIAAVLLTVIQEPMNLSFLAWVALVPFVMGSLDNKTAAKWVIIISYAVGVIYWLVNLHWLFSITMAGWLVACLYLAVYWPLVATALRFCSSRRIPLWFALPILIVGEETMRGALFSWRFLAHSQFSHLPLIQIADIFGTAGVSFVIAMVNGIIAELIINRKFLKSQKANLITGGLITFIILSITISYGKYRIAETGKYTEDGPKIGIVQCNVPVTAGEDIEPFEKTFLDQLASSRSALMEAAPALIIWPETMVETTLDESYLKLVGENYASRVINDSLAEHANEGVNVLVGAFSGQAVKEGDEIKLKTKYNTAFLFEPNQPYSRQMYRKINLVPFGEYIPGKKEFPFLYKLLLGMTPYNYDYTLDAGTEYTIFHIQSGGKTYRFATSICFEDTVPKICRKLVAEDRIKQADWLVNISNDGWFIKKAGDKFKVSSELRQHMAICVFRAIENRVAVVRCANTGISCMIDSIGKIKDGFIAGTLKEKASERTAQSGWLVDSIKIDKRVTIFSKSRQILGGICAICLILSAVMSIYYNKLKVNSEK